MELRREYEELKEKIDYHSHLYYDLDAPELDDFEFDALTRRLKEIEAQHPEFVTEASFTQHVGGTASGRFEKVEHAVKMESLQVCFLWMKCANLTGVCAMKAYGRSMW